jgi:hypothetical protein
LNGIGSGLALRQNTGSWGLGLNGATEKLHSSRMVNERYGPFVNLYSIFAQLRFSELFFSHSQRAAVAAAAAARHFAGSTISSPNSTNLTASTENQEKRKQATAIHYS